MRKHERRRNQEVWKVQRAGVAAQWAEKARNTDHEAPTNLTTKFTKCTECGVHTRKGHDTESHTKWHEVEGWTDRVVRV